MGQIKADEADQCRKRQKTTDCVYYFGNIKHNYIKLSYKNVYINSRCDYTWPNN